MNGHASYTAFEFTVPCIMEFGTIPATSEASLESQAMELDADFTAARSYGDHAEADRLGA